MATAANGSACESAGSRRRDKFQVYSSTMSVLQRLVYKISTTLGTPKLETVKGTPIHEINGKKLDIDQAFVTVTLKTI